MRDKVPDARRSDPGFSIDRPLNLGVRPQGKGMRRGFLLTLLGFLILASCRDTGAPRPNEADYVISTRAGFAMTPGRGVYYSMEFELRRTFAKAVFVVAIFENPADSSIPMRVGKTVDADMLAFVVESPKLNVLKNYKEYNVELLLYADSGHTEFLGRHRQKVLFSVSPEFTSRLEQQFSIRIL